MPDDEMSCTANDRSKVAEKNIDMWLNVFGARRPIFGAIFFVPLGQPCSVKFRNEANSWAGQSTRRLGGRQTLLTCVKNEQRLNYLSPQSRLVPIDPLNRETVEIAEPQEDCRRIG